MAKFLTQSGFLKFWAGIKAKLSPITLYENDLTAFPNSDFSISTLPITLNQSCIGFDELIVEGIVNNGRFITTRVLSPYAGKKFQLTINQLAGETSGTSWIYSKVLNCEIGADGTTIIAPSGGWAASGQRSRGDAANSSSYTAGYFIAITRVLGIYY